MIDFKNIDLKTILLIIIIAILLFQHLVNTEKPVNEKIVYDGKKYELIKDITDTLYLTKYQTKYIKGNDIYHEKIRDIRTIDVERQIDTVYIIRDYFTKTIYKDTLILKDSLGRITIIDTISENKIIGRLWNTEIVEKNVNKTMILKELPRNAIYFGINSGFNKDYGINSLSSGLLLKTKKDKILQLNVGVSNNGTNLSPFVNGGIYWKIKLKK